MEKTIADVEAAFEQSLASSWDRFSGTAIPRGYRLRVQLQDTKHRKKRSTASADNWSPEAGEILVWFEPAEDGDPPPGTETQPTAPFAGKLRSPSEEFQSNSVSDVIRTLDRIEGRPGYDFIALTWFRDTVLVAEGFDWARPESMRRAVIGDVIEKRLVLTSKVANPKTPERPVTAIRLNRLMPEVKKILGVKDEVESDFRPVEIRGEPLSVTIMRERHR